MAVTSNILQRTFWVGAFDSGAHGTAFGIEKDNRFLLVSARHVFDGSRIDKILIFREKKWQEIAVKAIVPPNEVDAILFEVSEPLWPLRPIELGEESTALGEDAFACGFPLGLAQIIPSHMSNGYPIGFVAKGCIAAINFKDSPLGTGLYLSVALDRGYSGGPVVLSRGMEERPIVVGFVSHNLRYKEQVEGPEGRRIEIRNPANLVYCEAASVIRGLPI